ncbi:hypothetical protein DFH08DRAFT_827292, partial [Mycena albidolilacea]
GRAKAKAKGKAKAPELDVVDGDGTGSDRAGSDDEDEDKGHTCGPLSAEVEPVSRSSNKFPDRHRQPRQKLWEAKPDVASRTRDHTPKVGRAPSAWNVWQKWWADEEDAKNLPRGQFAKAVRRLESQMQDRRHVHGGHAQRLRGRLQASPMAAQVARHHECAGSGGHPEQGEIEGEVAMRSQSSNPISKQLYNSYKVHCWGYVIDTQGDSSFVFGEGDDFKEMRQTQLHNLAQQMKDQEHMFGMIEMRKRGIEAQTVPSKTLVMQANKKLRDLNRRQFISILANQLWQCRIQNYPPALEQAGLIIGTPSFNIKKITSEMFAKFLPDMEKASERPREHECMLSLEEQAAIGIVLSVNGRILAAVNHSDRYQKEVADAARKAEKEKGKGKRRRTQQQRGHDYDDSGRRPISPRAGRDNYDAETGPPSAAAPPPIPAPAPPTVSSTRPGTAATPAPALPAVSSTGPATAAPAPALPPVSSTGPLAAAPTPAPLAVPSTGPLSTATPDPLRTLGRRPAPVTAHAAIPPLLAAPCRHAPPTRSTPIPALRAGTRALLRGIRGCTEAAERQDARVCGEDLATARRPPLDEGERGHALADRVSGAAKRKAHPEGEEDSERNPKRACEMEMQEPRVEPPPLLRMWLAVQEQVGRIFYARGLQRVAKTSRADRHTLMQKPETGEWVALRANMTPKLASTADAELYTREVENWGLVEPRPSTNLITQVFYIPYFKILRPRVLKTQVVQRWKLSWKLTGRAYLGAVAWKGIALCQNVLELPLRRRPTRAIPSRLFSTFYDPLVARTNWSSTSDTLECLRTPGALSELSSAQQAPAYNALVARTDCSAPDTLECLRTPGAPSKRSSAQQAPAYDALVARTDYSAPDTLECLRTPGAPSERSSAQQAPAYDALVARTDCSAPDTLECLRTPGAPSERSSAQQAPAYGMPDLSSEAAEYRPTYPVITSQPAVVPLRSLSIGETAHMGRMRFEAQIAEHMKFRMYRERRGKVYHNYRRNMQDGSLQGKIGWTSNMKRRRASYKRCESTIQQIVWVAAWECRHPKRVGGGKYIAYSGRTGEEVDVVDIQWRVNESDKRELRLTMKSRGMYTGAV